MKLDNENIKIANLDSGHWFCVKLRNDQLDPLNKILNNDKKETVIDVSDAKVKRSHTANSYLWVLCNLIAKKLNLPKGDVYVKMIKRYGIYHEMTAKDIALTTLIKVWDGKNTSVEHTESLCEVTNSFRSKGIVWHELHCYEGSSDYDSGVFSKLLKGVVDECEILGISTMTPQEIQNLIKMMEG